MIAFTYFRIHYESFQVSGPDGPWSSTVVHFYCRGKAQIPILSRHIGLISDKKAAGVWGCVRKLQSPIFLIVVKYQGSIWFSKFYLTSSPNSINFAGN